MTRKLTQQLDTKRKGVVLTKAEVPFRISIEHSLENNYCFKKMNNNAMKELDNFIKETVDKNLSISKVDELFLRTKGNPIETVFFKGEDRDIVHYGKDRKQFRLFGYYNGEGYFVLTSLDNKHKKHRE